MEYVNTVELRGNLGGLPRYSHSSRGLDFLVFPLEVRRLSGTLDTLNCVARRELLQELELRPLEKLAIKGSLRSFNNRSGQGARLVISVYVQEIALCQGEDENRVNLIGTLCKAPTLRRTPLGRELCDLSLAVNRSYGRSDYLPCICWGRWAREAAHWDVGTRVSLQGRIQSRNYTKLSPEGPLEKTAFEVSASEIHRLEDF